MPQDFTTKNKRNPLFPRKNSRFLARVSLKDLRKSRNINGLQTASKATVVTICEDSSKRIKLTGSALSSAMFDYTFARRNLYKNYSIVLHKLYVKSITVNAFI